MTVRHLTQGLVQGKWVEAVIKVGGGDHCISLPRNHNPPDEECRRKFPLVLLCKSAKLLLLYPVYSSLLQAACLCHGTSTVALPQAVSSFRSALCILFWEQDEGTPLLQASVFPWQRKQARVSLCLELYLATSTYIPASQ